MNFREVWNFAECEGKMRIEKEESSRMCLLIWWSVIIELSKFFLGEERLLERSFPFVEDVRVT